jgi:hypothetical protein
MTDVHWKLDPCSLRAHNEAGTEAFIPVSIDFILGVLQSDISTYIAQFCHT